MCSPPNDKYNLSYSRNQHSRKRQLRTWFLCFSWSSFFAFWGTVKQLFHIASFRSTSYVLKSFGCLEVSNSVSNRNKVKHRIFVESMLQICQLEIPVFVYKFMSQSALWFSFSYGICEFNRVASWNKGKTLILARSSFQICQPEIMVSYSN
jgi:hypothetical protein